MPYFTSSLFFSLLFFHYPKILYNYNCHHISHNSMYSSESLFYYIPFIYFAANPGAEKTYLN